MRKIKKVSILSYLNNNIIMNKILYIKFTCVLMHDYALLMIIYTIWIEANFLKIFFH